MYNNNYEELKTFLPVFYDDVFEMQAILEVSGDGLDKAENGLDRVLLNNFIMDADENAIARLEKFLYLQVDRMRPLDERKRLLASFFVGFGKMSATNLKEIVYSFTSAASEVFFNEGIVSIEIERGSSPSLYLIDVDTIISRRIPAHLPFILVVKYTVLSVIGAVVSGYKFEYPLTNTLLCGTHPVITTFGQLESASVNTLAEINNFTYYYILCGTRTTGV